VGYDEVLQRSCLCLVGAPSFLLTSRHIPMQLADLGLSSFAGPGATPAALAGTLLKLSKSGGGCGGGGAGKWTPAYFALDARSQRFTRYKAGTGEPATAASATLGGVVGQGDGDGVARAAPAASTAAATAGSGGVRAEWDLSAVQDVVIDGSLRSAEDSAVAAAPPPPPDVLSRVSSRAPPGPAARPVAFHVVVADGGGRVARRMMAPNVEVGRVWVAALASLCPKHLTKSTASAAAIAAVGGSETRALGNLAAAVTAYMAAHHVAAAARRVIDAALAQLREAAEAARRAEEARQAEAAAEAARQAEAAAAAEAARQAEAAAAAEEAARQAEAAAAAEAARQAEAAAAEEAARQAEAAAAEEAARQAEVDDAAAIGKLSESALPESLQDGQGVDDVNAAMEAEALAAAEAAALEAHFAHVEEQLEGAVAEARRDDSERVLRDAMEAATRTNVESSLASALDAAIAEAMADRISINMLSDVATDAANRVSGSPSSSLLCPVRFALYARSSIASPPFCRLVGQRRSRHGGSRRLRRWGRRTTWPPHTKRKLRSRRAWSSG